MGEVDRLSAAGHWLTLSFDDETVELTEMDGFFVVPSPLPTETVDADVFVRSRGVGVLTSLLLLSFKLRRRTGFLRIRLHDERTCVIGRRGKKVIYLKLAFRLLK
jgi:hypothetical protein